MEQYQSWTRRILIVHQLTKVFMQVSEVFEYYINSDYYNYNTTTHVVHFEQGKYLIDVRIVHDVGVFGEGKTLPQC